MQENRQILRARAIPGRSVDDWLYETVREDVRP